jgi:serine phosphatase RsbU (regulator of sigma subunit)
MTSTISEISERFERVLRRIMRGGSLRAFLKGFYGLLAYIILLVIDLVAHSLKTIQGPTLDVARALLQTLSLYFWGRALFGLYFRHKDLQAFGGKSESSTVPVQGLRWLVSILILSCIFALIPSTFTLQLTALFEAKSPSTVVSITIITAIWFAGASILIGMFVKMVYLWQNTRETRFRMVLWTIPIILFSLYNYLLVRNYLPQDTLFVLIGFGFRGLIVFATLFLWFRIPWIPHLSSKAKNQTLILSAASTLLAVAAFIFYSTDLVDNLLRNYATVLHSVIGGMYLGVGAYSGLVFFNALFTLSSTELVERRQAEVQSLAKLTRFSSDVLTSDLLLDIPKLADQITVLACEATQSDAAWLELRNTPLFGGAVVEEVIRSFDGISEQNAMMISERLSPDGKSVSIAEELARTERSIIVNRIDEERSNGVMIGSLLVIPLMHKSKLRGALYVAKEREYGYDQEDVTVLTAFADVASLAFDTARLLTDSIEKQKLDGELRAARSMQKSLLPSPQSIPRIPEFQLDALSIPAYEVGGDYYDFLTMSDGSPLVVTGDVSGKGISASIFMAEIKGIVQALAPANSNARELCIMLNDILMRSTTTVGGMRSFVTLATITISSDGWIRYCRAGHTPLLHFSATGDFRYHQPKGMGIGFVKRVMFEPTLVEESFLLGRGESLILFSDGITEIRNIDGDELGYQRFAEIVRGARFEVDVEKMKDRILREVLSFSGATSFTDDATFVIIRRN